jgi:hypothetical protein
VEKMVRKRRQSNGAKVLWVQVMSASHIHAIRIKTMAASRFQMCASDQTRQTEERHDWCGYPRERTRSHLWYE